MVKKICSRGFLSLMILAIYLPILILAVYSFTDSANIGAIHGFSLQNYITLFTKEELTQMISGTLLLAAGSSMLATILGTLGAVGVFYGRRFGKLLIGSLNQVPVVNADVVTGFSICILMIGVLGVDKSTFIPLVVGHVVLSAPFVYLAVAPKLQQMDNSLYEAALDLGASPAMALRRVVIPQIMPGILSGFMLAFTLSLDDYFVTSYTKPATFDTISTYVVNATKGSQTEIKTALWALSTIIFVIVLLAVVSMNMAEDRNVKKAGAGNEKKKNI
ncbi:MAG: ABC transporter permease [Roseburia sp.]|nr:ABC transporter permease [Roseburia sp.]